MTDEELVLDDELLAELVLELDDEPVDAEEVELVLLLDTDFELDEEVELLLLDPLECEEVPTELEDE